MEFERILVRVVAVIFFIIATFALAIFINKEGDLVNENPKNEEEKRQSCIGHIMLLIFCALFIVGIIQHCSHM